MSRWCQAYREFGVQVVCLCNVIFKEREREFGVLEQSRLEKVWCLGSVMFDDDITFTVLTFLDLLLYCLQKVWCPCPVMC